MEEFFAYSAGFRGGVRIAVGDTDASEIDAELITGPGPTGGPHIKVFDDDGDAGRKIGDNALESQFLAFDAAMTRGVFVAYGQGGFIRQDSNIGSQPIPDGGSLTTSIIVDVAVGNIRDLNVRLMISHQNNRDLDVSLVHVPSGTTIELFTDAGFNDDGFYITLNDEAPLDIGSARPSGNNNRPIIGDFNPEGVVFLSAFDGIDASGEWRLVVVDDATTFSGYLLTWGLDIRV